MDTTDRERELQKQLAEVQDELELAGRVLARIAQGGGSSSSIAQVTLENIAKTADGARRVTSWSKNSQPTVDTTYALEKHGWRVEFSP